MPLPPLTCRSVRVRRGSVATGFTLIEVLVALVILSIGIVAVLRSFDTATVALADAREALQATLLAGEKLGEWKAAAAGQAADPPVGAFAETFMGGVWEGSVELDAVSAGAAVTNPLYRVRVQLMRGGGRIHERETFVRDLRD